MEKLRIALCGCQGKVEKFGALLNGYQESCVAAVWDYVPGRGEAVAQRLGCPFEGDYDRLLREYALDGVVIVAQNSLHAGLIERAARSGKHVFVEKPLCLDPAQARSIRRVIHETGVKFYMSDPFVHASTVYVKRLIEGGALGRITGARFRLGSDTALHPWEDHPIYDKSRALGGIMADVGGHMVHAAHYLFGRPARLTAVLSGISDAAKCNDIEENAVVLMQYPDDKLVTLECSWVCAGDTDAAEVYGTRGWARITRAPGGGPGEDAVTVQLDGQPPAAVPAQQLPPAPTRHVRYWVEMMARDLPNDIVGVDDLSNSGVSIDNAAEFVDILDAIYRSAREGRTVAL